DFADDTSLNISTAGNITLNASATAGSRIGSYSGNPAGGDISVNAGGDLALYGTATLGNSIRTTGNVTIDNGGSVVLQAGTGTNAFARIVNNFGGTPFQQFTFNAGGSMQITGGTVGTGNFAQVGSGGQQSINGATGIEVTGGASGGGFNVGNW